MATAAEMIERLLLKPHPEGGWYRETWRASEALPDGRAAATSILFLLEPGQSSHWHRVDAEELWIHQAGGPIRLSTARGATISRVTLGTAAGCSPQHLVRKGEWQSADADEGWGLVACVVAPAFRFEGFELAPPGWTPL